MVLVQDVSLIQNVVGSISATFSFFAFITYILFKPLRSLRYVELVFYVSLNDFIASVGVALGASPDNSWRCYFQGYTSNANYLSSILWTTVITYQVYLVIFYGSLIKKMVPFHVICWGIPFVTATLVFSTNTYGNTDDASSWCFVANTSKSPSYGILLWELIAFYLWVWIAILFNIIMLFRIRWRIGQSTGDSETVMRATLRKLILYPIMVIACWTLDTIVNLLDIFHYRKTTALVNRIGVVLPMFQGMVFAIVFFAVNPIVRNYWKAFLFGVYGTGLELTQSLIYENALVPRASNVQEVQSRRFVAENIFDRTRSMNSMNDIDVQNQPDYVRQLESLKDAAAEDVMSPVMAGASTRIYINSSSSSSDSISSGLQQHLIDQTYPPHRTGANTVYDVEGKRPSQSIRTVSMAAAPDDINMSFDGRYHRSSEREPSQASRGSSIIL